MPLSDTFYTAAPHWDWLVVLYFFFGGIAGGSYFLAAMVDLWGRPEDARLARLGYLVSLPALLLCPPLLIADLTRPERFWHMLVRFDRGGLMLNPSSPISVGSWALGAFGVFAALAFVAAVAESGRPPWRWLQPLRALRRGAASRILAIGGGLLALFVAGYTGVLLSVTNRPLWADTPLLGLLFLLSATTTSAALLVLVGGRRTAASLGWLVRYTHRLGALELAALAAVILSLGPVARVWLSVWGVVVAAGVVLLGILVPYAIHARPRLLGGASAPVAAGLVIVGGFLLRAAVILSSEAL